MVVCWTESFVLWESFWNDYIEPIPTELSCTRKPSRNGCHSQKCCVSCYQDHVCWTTIVSTCVRAYQKIETNRKQLNHKHTMGHTINWRYINLKMNTIWKRTASFGRSIEIYVTTFFCELPLLVTSIALFCDNEQQIWLSAVFVTLYCSGRYMS